MIKYIASLFATLALVACGQKPPGCADTETLNTIRSLVVDDTKKALAKQAADDPEGWVQKFLDGLKVEVSGIVNNGYNADTKKQQCRGTMRVATPTDPVAERSIDYSTQVTEDQKRAFLLEIQNFEPFVVAVAQSASSFYDANRWSGTWSGTYACSGVNGTTTGLQGPFSLTVSMVVNGSEATLERTTRSGGIEKLKGRFDRSGLSRPFELAGTGQNTPEDEWLTSFVGQANGLKLVASGDIRVAVLNTTAPSTKIEMVVARTCTLELALSR